MGMKIRKFKAPTLQKALEQIRQEMGDGAIILQADPIKDGGFGRNAVEVTAATDKPEAIPRFNFKVTDDVGERDLAQSSSEKAKGFISNIFKKKAKAEKPENSKSFPPIAKPENLKRVLQAAKKNSSGSQTTDSSASPGQIYAFKSYIEPLQKEMANLKELMIAEHKRSEESPRAPSNAYIETELASLKKIFSNFINEQRFEEKDLPPNFKKLLNFWRDKGMSNRQIYGFFEKFEREGIQFDPQGSSQALKPLLSQSIREGRNTENPKQKIVTLVGPTGVGKTTTIAKLAAFEKLKLHRTAALVTIDDYKIGGTDQLAHFARILEIPFIKVRSDLSLEEQIKHLNVDTVFIDTYGIAPKDDKKMTELRKSLQFRDPTLLARQERHLVLPVGVASSDVDQIMDSFTRLAPQYLLFTKWDETENWGGMLACILESKTPVSFVGHGQEVPDDLSIFSRNSFIETIMGKEQ